MVELKEKQQNTMRVKDNIQFHFERIRNSLQVAPRQHMRR